MKKVYHLPYQIDPDKNRNHYYETLWKIRALDLLQKHEPELSGLELLDYGCGRGETLDLAGRRGMRVRGVDLDPECVSLASAYGKCEVLNPDDPVGQIGAKSVDVVACFHVLEHVPSPVTTLSHLARIARKYVLLAVPNLRTIPDFLRPRRNVFRVNEGHLQSWDYAHLLNLAENHCGLRHVDWGFDQVKIPMVSSSLCRFFGQKAAIRLETGIFLRLFPYQATSIIGLFKMREDDGDRDGGDAGEKA